MAALNCTRVGANPPHRAEIEQFLLWNTLELPRTIEELRSEGVEMTAEQLHHLSPMDWEHIGLTGDYTWDFTAKSSRA